ncbi:hypothetical protein HRbin23_00244 [bacterium HR23]|nr:hypothetical protein HRbin23_00244 [bacterium HR23]
MPVPKQTLPSVVAVLTPLGLVDLGAPPQQAPGEQFLPYLFVAFALVWLVFFGYLFYLVRRQADLRRDLENLRRSQAEGEPSHSSHTPSRRE